jgi:hypothetical protein
MQIDLEIQRIQVLTGALMVLGDDLVAGAVVADRLAERDVDVERQRRFAPTTAPSARCRKAQA